MADQALPDVGDVINLKLALDYYGIAAPTGEELGRRYQEYASSLMRAVLADLAVKPYNVEEQRDIELCAEAMGVKRDSVTAEWVSWIDPDGKRRDAIWDPIQDDAQAMALVKKFRLMIFGNAAGFWQVEQSCGDSSGAVSVLKNLNVAIVKCVAKIQSHEEIDRLARALHNERSA